MKTKVVIGLFALIGSMVLAYAKDSKDINLDDASAAGDWLGENAIPITSLDMNGSFEDLLPLEEVIGDARIVSMGEATHGTREFYLLKNRLFKFLSMEHGFNLFGLENSFGNALPVNDYVTDGVGDADVVYGLDFDSYRTEEFSELIGYMRQYNKSKKSGDKLHFYGFDNQQPSLNLKGAFQYLNKVDADIVPQYKEVVIRSDEERYTYDQRDEKRVNAYKELLSVFDTNKTTYIKKSSPEEWSIARQSVVIASQHEKMYGLGHAFPIGYGAITAWESEVKLKKELNSLYEVLDACVALPQGTKGKMLPSFSGSFYDFFIHYRYDMTKNQRAEAESATELAIDALKSSKKACTKRLDKESYAAAQDTLNSVKTLLEEYKKSENTSYVGDIFNVRDWAMAENVKWMLDYHGEDSKIALFAHNGHVARHSGRPGYGLMGDYLEYEFNDDYLAVGFVFNQGGFSAMDWKFEGFPRKEVKVGPSRQGTVGEVMSRPGIPMYAVDLRNIPNSGPVYRWFNTPQKFKFLGGSIHSDLLGDRFEEDITLSDAYDVLVFVDATTPIMLLEKKPEH